MEISAKNWKENAKKLFGDDMKEWKFICLFCRRVQSVNSILKEQEEGIESMRFGKLDKEQKKNISPYSCCYSPTCNCASNGLFTPETLVIYDPDKPHDSALKKNCVFVFDFA